jgi:hypothetical protein
LLSSHPLFPFLSQSGGPVCGKRHNRLFSSGFLVISILSEMTQHTLNILVIAMVRLGMWRETPDMFNTFLFC